MVIENITKLKNVMNSYKDLVNSSPVVLVEFYAQWCPHCQRMMPVVDEIKELLAGSATVYQLDVDHNEAIAQDEKITGTPTFIIYRDGKEVWRNSGEMDGNVLLEKVQRFMTR